MLVITTLTYDYMIIIFFHLGDDEELNDDGETAAEAAASVARQARMAKAVELKAAKVLICIQYKTICIHVSIYMFTFYISITFIKYIFLYIYVG
jgi:hypothetical protein